MGGETLLREGVNASECVQRTVGALVVTPVSWDCAYGVAERWVEDLRTGQDLRRMIRCEPLRPVYFSSEAWYLLSSVRMMRVLQRSLFRRLPSSASLLIL